MRCFISSNRASCQKTGKRFEWQVGMKSDNPLSGLFQDYDWADEVLH